MRNIALRLQYDGSNYHGWQVQKTEVTVAETLEKALSKVMKHPVKVVGCGRTDAGVHALRYCANFRTDCTIPVERVPLAVNARLPGDISVTDAVEAPEDFNAIGSCIQKEYIYRIHNSRVRDAFLERRACFYPYPLEIETLQKAGAAFEGTHDFAAVRSVGTETKTTVRTVHWCRAEREGDLITSGYDGLCLPRQARPGGDPAAARDARPPAHRPDHAAAGTVPEPGVVRRGSRGNDDEIKTSVECEVWSVELGYCLTAMI